MGKGDKRKRGRPRQEGPREPNGRLQRPKAKTFLKTLEKMEHVTFETGPMQTVLKRRRFEANGVFSDRPVTKREAEALGLAHRGLVLENWREDYALDMRQGKPKAKRRGLSSEDFEAALAFAILRETYRRAAGLPKETISMPPLGHIGSTSTGGLRRMPASLKDEHDRAVAALINAGGRVWYAIRAACVLDQPAPIHLVREGCKVLRRIND